MKYRYIRRLKCPKNLLPFFKATRALQWLGYYALPHNLNLSSNNPRQKYSDSCPSFSAIRLWRWARRRSWWAPRSPSSSAPPSSPARRSSSRPSYRERHFEMFRLDESDVLRFPSTCVRWDVSCVLFWVAALWLGPKQNTRNISYKWMGTQV